MLGFGIADPSPLPASFAMVPPRTSWTFAHRLALDRVEQDAAEFQEVGLAGRGRPPSQSDVASRLRLDEAQEFDALVTHLNVDRHFGQQRYAIAACHHLQDGGQTGRPQPSAFAAYLTAIDERLIAQTVAFFQQHQPACLDVARGDLGAFRQRVLGRYGQQEPVVEQDAGFELALLDGKGQQNHLQRPLRKLAQQRLGPAFKQIEAQVRIAAVEFRQQQGQHVGCQRPKGAKSRATAPHRRWGFSLSSLVLVIKNTCTEKSRYQV